MGKLEDRVFSYSALVCLCAITSVFLGMTAAAWTFIQIASVIELMYLFGDLRSKRRLPGYFEKRL